MWDLAIDVTPMAGVYHPVDRLITCAAVTENIWAQVEARVCVKDKNNWSRNMGTLLAGILANVP